MRIKTLNIEKENIEDIPLYDGEGKPKQGEYRYNEKTKQDEIFDKGEWCNVKFCSDMIKTLRKDIDEAIEKLESSKYYTCKINEAIDTLNRNKETVEDYLKDLDND